MAVSRTWVEIQIMGTLNPNWTDWFGGMEIRRGPRDTTFLSGWVADQAALHGCLSKIRDLNLPLLCVRCDAAAVSRRRPRGERGVNQ